MNFTYITLFLLQVTITFNPSELVLEVNMQVRVSTGLTVILTKTDNTQLSKTVRFSNLKAGISN